MREPISANKAVEGRLRVEGIFSDEVWSCETYHDMLLILWEGDRYTFTVGQDLDPECTEELRPSTSTSLYDRILSDEDRERRQTDRENEKQAKAAREAELTEARERSELARLRHKYERVDMGDE